jgi:hypothetical protein
LARACEIMRSTLNEKVGHESLLNALLKLSKINDSKNRSFDS